MAVNEKGQKIGLQKDGSVVCAENDWCLEFVRNLPWNEKKIRKTGPWLTKDEIEGTVATKYMNYQSEENYIDPNNPFRTGVNIPELRKDENRGVKKRSKDNEKIAEFNQIHEKVREVPGQDQNTNMNASDSLDEDDEAFVDEFGNVIDDETQEAIAAKAKELLARKT